MELPSHVAVIMDGNGRWAQKQGLPRREGHKKGVKNLKKIVKKSASLGIDCLTVYAFSTENWKRPGSEVNFLMKLFKKTLREEVDELIENNVVVKVLGRKQGLNKEIIKQIDKIEKRSQKNSGLRLNIAFNYGGRAEIVDGINKILSREIKEVSIENFKEFLYDTKFSEVDLLIRTGGEKRISNFLLWQIAYAEIYISDYYWPELSPSRFQNIIEEFQNRDRRFGGL